MVFFLIDDLGLAANKRLSLLATPVVGEEPADLGLPNGLDKMVVAVPRCGWLGM